MKVKLHSAYNPQIYSLAPTTFPTPSSKFPGFCWPSSPVSDVVLLSSVNDKLSFSQTCMLCACILSFLQLCHPMDYTGQAPLSMGFSRQEYWSGLPFPPPVDLPDPGIEPTSPALAGRFFTMKPSRKPYSPSHPGPKTHHWFLPSPCFVVVV